jgi:hypothetical protein
VRNVFDQYVQQENRLTHALAVCLDEDRVLLRRFLKWIDVPPPVHVRSIDVVEQGLPGEHARSEEEAQRRGLPDIVIHADEDWCLLIESKVQASLSTDQLRRHTWTLRRRGFRRVYRLILTKRTHAVKGTVARTWSNLYEWLGDQDERPWPHRLRAYLRAAEARLASEKYLTEGTLTMFDGFQFIDDESYAEGEARRLLKLAIQELRRRPDLRRIGVDPKATGRPALSGLWDFLALRDRPKGPLFTRWPHLTLASHPDHLEVAITIPHGVDPAVRKRLIALGPDGLTALNMQILRRARRLLSRGARVEAYAVQRHYRTQRSPADVDARLVFKLSTTRGQGQVKTQPEWLTLFETLLRRKRSNIQFGYVVRLPWTTRGLSSRQSLDLIAESWKALSPVLAVARGR